MEISTGLLRQIESDLGLNIPFIKGETKTVKNCWHFSTNGNDVDAMFYDEDDFRKGMNRIYVVSLRYKVIILAFVLMDTHVHFVLYGSYSECVAFMYEYIRCTSRYIAVKYREHNKLRDVTISHQSVDTDRYLKTVICYTIKNPCSGGMPHMPFNYPWSSGPLYFAGIQSWSACSWTKIINQCPGLKDLSYTQTRQWFNARDRLETSARIIDGLIFPGDYVAYELVQRIFKTCKSFQFFLGQSKEDEIESRGGTISNLSIPMQEMRQHKAEVCSELFGKDCTKSLTTTQRIRLAKTLKARYNSSVKQIIRLCGLNYNEVKDLI